MKLYRLSQVARKLNIGKDTILETLANNGIHIENNPNSKLTDAQVDLLAEALALEVVEKEEAHSLTIGRKSSYDNRLATEQNEKSCFVILRSSEHNRSVSFSAIIARIEKLVGTTPFEDTKPPVDVDPVHFSIVQAFISGVGLDLHGKPEENDDSRVELVKFYRSLQQKAWERETLIQRMKLAIKNVVKGFKSKRRFPNFRQELRSIIPLQIYHLFTNDEEENRDALEYLSLSVTLL